MRKCYDVKKNFGIVNLHLKEYLDKRGITRNALSVSSGVRYDIITRYYNGSVTRIDLENLAKICYTLECNLSDILTYDE